MDANYDDKQVYVLMRHIHINKQQHLNFYCLSSIFPPFFSSDIMFNMQSFINLITIYISVASVLGLQVTIISIYQIIWCIKCKKHYTFLESELL